MRDDLHKSVPRRRNVQRWVRYALREADRIVGRSQKALDDVVRSVATQEISTGFRAGLIAHVHPDAPSLFGPLDGVRCPRDIGGTGGPIEQQILTDSQRAIADGTPPMTAVKDAMVNALKDRVHADIRAAEPVLLGSHDPEAPVALAQMRKDADAVDYEAVTTSVIDPDAGRSFARPEEKLSPDEDLLPMKFVARDV